MNIQTTVVRILIGLGCIIFLIIIAPRCSGCHKLFVANNQAHRARLTETYTIIHGGKTYLSVGKPTWELPKGSLSFTEVGTGKKIFLTPENPYRKE